MTRLSRFTTEAYGKHLGRRRLCLGMLFGAVLVLFLAEISVGASGMSFWETLLSLFGGGSEGSRRILWSIRLPRAVAALLAGAGLALSGCAMQSTLGNVMASPSTLGVSNAAVLGANFAIVVLGAGSFHSTHGEAVFVSSPVSVALCAFLAALASVMTVLALSAHKGFSPSTVVLAGVALGALFSAGTTLIQYFAMDSQVAAAVFWTFGDLGRADWWELAVMAAVILPSGIFFFCNRWGYNAICAGEETAGSLGVRVAPLRMVTLLLASLITAVCVCYLGVIGFVGLVAPAAVRRFVGDDHSYLLPASALAGGALILLSDTVARVLPFSLSLPVGAMTSLIGAPVFLWLILKGRRTNDAR